MTNFSRTWCLLVALAACGDDTGENGEAGPTPLEPPTCEPDGVLRYVHDLGGTEVSGELPKNGYIFANKVSNDDPGILAVGDAAADNLRVEFQMLLPHGGTTSATGRFKIGDLEAGNCETTRPSRIHALADEGWEVTLVDLHTSPFCTGEALTGSFAACLIPEPF